MRFALCLLAALGLGLAAPWAGPATAAMAEARPVVVELFTSQGCSSCPPANANLAKLSERPDIIALSFGVTYWDSLGWKDTFAQAKFTDRQRAYERALGHAGPFTPQVVVNGRVDGVGAGQGDIERLIAKAGSQDGPAVRVAGGKVSVASGPSPRRAADVWLVRYDPRVVQVPIQRGENGGKTLPHKNVVRELTRLGSWSGAAAAYALPAPKEGLRSVVLVQAPDAGPILSAARG